MQPLRISSLVYRRTSQAIILIAAAFSLYAWKVVFFPVSTSLVITPYAIIGATLSLLVALVALVWRPPKYSTVVLYIAYALLAGATAYLVLVNHYAPLTLTLWALVAVFAGIFSGYGIVPIFIAGNYYLFLSIIDGTVSSEILLTTLVTGWLPALTGYILWHKAGGANTKGPSMIDSLTSELNQVAGKSEVVIGAIADGVIAIDSKGVIELINPAAQHITGWSAHDAVSLSYKSVLKLFNSKDQIIDEANDPIAQVLTTNQEIETEMFSISTHSDKKLLASITVSPVGQLGQGAIIVFRDITKDKKEEREQAEFISTASHEMRTPVASIEGYLGLALNPATAQIDDKARDFITKAHESAQHLGRLFQDLLDVSKADDSRLSNSPTIVDVAQFAGTIVEGLRPQADAKQLRLVYKPGLGGEEDVERRLTPIFYAHVDNDHLREVVANLTENAIKYTPHGDIIIDVTGDTSHIVISFQDSGIGIPSEDIPHLFQKFYRVDNSDTREIGGTGLGLYLCRRLTEIMGGRIWVESEFKKGSTFYIELPRISHEEANRLIEEATQRAEQAAAAEAALPQPTTTAASEPIPIPSATPAPAAVDHLPPPAAAPAAHTPVGSGNIPLSSIEKHPEAYVQERAQTVSVPPRTPGGQN